jgi:hypothetical protein
VDVEISDALPGADRYSAINPRTVRSAVERLAAHS